jgi:hypothetical protein
VSHLDEGAEPAVAAHRGDVESSSVKAGCGSDFGTVSDFHSTHLRDAPVLFSVENVSKTATPDNSFGSDDASSTDLTPGHHHGARSYHGPVPDLGLGTDKGKGVDLHVRAKSC